VRKITDDPFDMNLTKAISHMHRHGAEFDATLAGTTLLQTSKWADPPPALFSPPWHAKRGDPRSFSCAYANSTSQTLTFGESAATKEMCALVASFYPLPDASMVTVGCQ
jgi:hypothetical protein